MFDKNPKSCYYCNMNTVDEFLQFIVKSNFVNPFETIESKDKKILISLYKHVNDTFFITEKQGNLLLRTLNLYKDCFDINYKKILEYPTWSRPFRILQTTKNISISKEKNCIEIEFSYDKDIKKKIMMLMSKVKGNYSLHSPTLISVDLNERNILLLLDNLRPLNFKCTADLLELYKNIQVILEQKQDILDATVNFNSMFEEKILKEISDKNTLLEVKILDRRIRYQYNFKLHSDSNELYFQIANRTSTNIFVNSLLYRIHDILTSLEILERLPVLIILDSRNVSSCTNCIADLAKYNTLGTKGVYFRFDNSCEENTNFNNLIKNYHLNSVLDDTTSMAVISNNTLPKFFIKTGWRPKSVISLTNSFRNNKAHVYCNDVDLKIYYNNAAPIIGDLCEIV